MTDLTVQDLLDRNDLDVLIGDFLLAEELHSKDFGDDEKRNLGVRWFRLRLSQLRAAICGNQAIEAAVESGETNLLAAAVVDAILHSSVGLDVPVTVLAAKVIQVGIRRICSHGEEGSSKDELE